MDSARNTTQIPAGQTLRGGHSLEAICDVAFSSSPSDVTSIGEGSNGCRAFRLRISDKWLKCYECASSERARMVQKATQVLENAGTPIPRIHQVVEHIVFAEWIDGNLLTQGKRRTTLEQIASYQARIHLADISTIPMAVGKFVHLEWLLERMKAASRKYVSAERVDELSQSVIDLVPADLKPGIIQPDFIKSNIVETPNGELVIVDNEFLGIGLGFEFDIVNSSRVISECDEGLCRQYLDGYAVMGDCGTLLEHSGFWDICYLTKLVGKRFLIGDAEMANVCLELLWTKVQKYADGRSD